jgi:hypothetical protein
VRNTSIIQTALTYTTFLALSVALHVVVILGNRPLDTMKTDQDSATAAPATAEDAPGKRAGERVK